MGDDEEVEFRGESEERGAGWGALREARLGWWAVDVCLGEVWGNCTIDDERVTDGRHWRRKGRGAIRSTYVGGGFGCCLC